MRYVIKEEGGRCLECGEVLDYKSRSDRKFCDSACRSRWHNRITHLTTLSHSRVVAAINRNYYILDTLIKKGIKSAPLSDLLLSGFSEDYFTGALRTRYRCEYSCFEIKYCIRGSYVTEIRRGEITV